MSERRPWCIALVLLVWFVALPEPAFAGSTPVATPPLAPAADQCLQRPIQADRLLQIMATPAATPIALSPSELTGDPAADETGAAVRATLIELFACLNAGEPLRAYHLYSDAYLRLIGARQGGFSTESIRLLATPDPLSPDDRTVVLDISDVRTLADGRVAATVRLDPALVPVPKIFTFVLVQVDDRWLVDDVLDEITFSIP